MSILTMFEIPGDPDELLSMQDQKAESLLRPIMEQNGIISNVVVKTEGGIMVVNHWETAEGMEKASDEIRPEMEAAGMPRPESWRSYEVLRHRNPGK